MTDPLFEVHMLNEQGKAKAQAIAAAFDYLLTTLRKLCPDNTREFSLVKTKLEEAAFFAKKAMATQILNTVGSTETQKSPGSD